jgi:hypothetical protein
MNITWTPDGGESIHVQFGSWAPDESGVPCATADAGGLRIRAWRDGDRLDAVAYHPATGPGKIAGLLEWPQDKTTLVLDGGIGWIMRIGPSRKVNPLPEHAKLIEALGVAPMDAMLVNDAAQFSDDWPNPDVAGSPRIAQAEPVWLTHPRDEHWREVRIWTDDQVLRPMLYDDPPPFAVIGERGIGSSAGWRNPDNGHLEVSRLATGWLVFRDPLSRWLLGKYGQMLLSRQLARDGDWHGEETRGLGYMLHDLAILHVALGEQKYADAVRRVLDGGPYSDSIIHLPNATMGASSHGYASPKEGRRFFSLHGLPYKDAWDALEPKARLAAYVVALKAADGGKHGLTVGSGGLFDWIGRPVVVWQLGIVARGAALCALTIDDGDTILAASNLVRRCVYTIITHGRLAGYDSADKHVAQAVTVHDAYQARWPVHEERVKIPHGGTTLWIVPALALAIRSNALTPALDTRARELLAAIMSKATPTDRERAETVWPFYAMEAAT